MAVRRLKISRCRQVLLTFDDGPHEDITPQVLERLETHNARAIFFVVGDRIKRSPAMLKTIIEKGHWLGNHTYTHTTNRKLRYAEYLNELHKCEELIIENTGSAPRFHRPPMGLITPATILSPKQLNLTTVMWSLSSEDWRLHEESETNQKANELCQKVKSRDIILFHDERAPTLTILDILLPHLEQRGFNMRPNVDAIC